MCFYTYKQISGGNSRCQLNEWHRYRITNNILYADTKRGYERDGCVRACSPRVNQDATSSFKASYFLSLQRAISTRARNRATHAWISISRVARVISKYFTLLFLKKKIRDFPYFCFYLFLTIYDTIIAQLLSHWSVIYFILFCSVTSDIK